MEQNIQVEMAGCRSESHKDIHRWMAGVDTLVVFTFEDWKSYGSQKMQKKKSGT